MAKTLSFFYSELQDIQQDVCVVQRSSTLKAGLPCRVQISVVSLASTFAKIIVGLLGSHLFFSPGNELLAGYTGTYSFGCR